MSDTTRIIEIEGVKIEVDLRTAKRIDHLQVGSRVKVLTKTYSGHQVHPGVVVGFEPFEKLPTIVIAYLEVDYSKVDLKFLHFNANTKEIEVIAAVDDPLDFDRDRVRSFFDRARAKLDRAIEENEMRRQYFEQNFKQFWAPVEQPVHEPEVSA